MLIRRFITLTTSIALSIGLLALPADASASASNVRTHSLRSARAGAGYLARQIDAGGGHLVSFGAPDVTNTAYAVLGLHAAGVGARQSARAVAFLETQLANLQGSDGNDDPGALGYVIMAAVAGRQDPRNFGGTRILNNLVRRLRATVRTSGVDKGLFGTADPTFDGAFRQGVALAALAAAGVAARTIHTSLAWLEHQQCRGGLWTSYRADVTAPCPAPDPANFTGPDTNSTSMAVQGLAAFHRFPKAGRVVRSLRHVESSDGGFPYIAAPGGSSDPNSTALVLQAFLAERVRPSAESIRALESFQLGCADPQASRGAYFFPGSRTPNLFATVQAVPAAASKPLPIGPSSPSTDVPRTRCPRSTDSSAARTTAAPVNAVGTAGPCPGKTGVTVTVDFTAFHAGVKTRCAHGAQSSGVAALQHAGFTVAGTARYGLAFICRINGRPTAAQQACVQTPPPTAFWAYYHALAGATTWTYSTRGATTYVPPLGSIDAWAFGNKAKPSRTPAQIRAGG